MIIDFIIAFIIVRYFLVIIKHACVMYWIYWNYSMEGTGFGMP